MFIHEYEQNERDNRILEALKVGRFDDNIIQSMKYDLTESQLGTIYTNIAQRLADGILPQTPSSNLQTPKTTTKRSFKKSANISSPPNKFSLPASPTAKIDKKPIPIKKIIQDNINDVFKRKEQVLQSIVIDQYRKKLEETKEETADVIEQLDTMIEQAMENTTLNENDLASVFTSTNKKFIHDPFQERRALAVSMGDTLITDEQ
ncbi:unnamed protein product [Adineta steineri]|nr:unnamed protein product [Adineta steineri]